MTGGEPFGVVPVRRQGNHYWGGLMNYARHLLLTICVLPGLTLAGDLQDIRNFKEYSPTFASAGQPTQEQLGDLKAAGFERIAYIAFSNSKGAIADEDAVVKELGMDYVHVPVIWEAPTKADFYAFAGAMQREPDKKTLLHCQANYRASAFAFLYRVLYQGIPVAKAKADMNSIWQPNETWRQLIFDVLEENGVSPRCEGCNWESDN